MPVLQNPRREKFAEGLAAGKSAAEAYELAGYKPNYGNCIRLKGNERTMHLSYDLCAVVKKCTNPCLLWANSGHWLSLLVQTFDRIDSEFLVLFAIDENFGVSRRTKRSLRLVEILKSYHYDPLRRLASN